MATPKPDAPQYTEYLLRAAHQFGTPTYVYVESTIRHQCAALQDFVAPLPNRLLYAMKANAQPAILRIMRSEGFGIDAVSPGELALALRVGFAPSDILFSANNMTDEEMDEAHNRGALLNIGELSRLEKYGQAFPGSAVCVRLNPQIGAGHHEHVVTAGARSKFGIPVNEVPAIQAIARRYRLDVRGLHQHIGSGILDARSFWLAIRVLLSTAGAFPDLQFLNVGGGLGIPYRPEDPRITLEAFREAIAEPLLAFKERHPADSLTFWFEPGRFLVAEAGVLLTRVNTLKQTREHTFAGTDSGMSHLLRPAMYGAHHEIRNLSNPHGGVRPYDVTGNICESADLFARGRPLPEIREGDILAVLDVGAYGMSMASTYNLRPLPAEVLLGTDGTLHLVRPRLTSQALAEALLANSAFPI